MNTPAHLLLGAAVFGRGPSKPVLWAALLGCALPDMSLYALAGVSLFVLNIPAERVFNDLYFSEAWQTVFAIDNSFVVWGGVLGLALWSRRAWAIALCGAALLHIALDFPLHHDDGRPHFWPVSDWVFESPVSYWDRDHGAMWVGPLEAGLAMAAALSIWLSRPGVLVSIFVALLVGLEMNTVLSWMFFFEDS